MTPQRGDVGRREWSPFVRTLAVLFLFAGVLLPVRAATPEVLRRTMLPADEKVYRYSEGAVLKVSGDKELLMAVSAFTHGGHDDSPARIFGYRSKDAGRTWTPSDPPVLQENIGKQNVMSPSFLRLSSKDVIFFFLITNNRDDAGMALRRSTDNGKTWGPVEKIPYDGYGGAANDHVIRLKSGRILMPYWVSRDKLKSTSSYCLYSDDQAHTWKRSNEITVPLPSIGRGTSPAAEEPAVIELKDGRIMMLVRTYVGWFYRSDSTDGGATWSPLVNSGIQAPGAMPTLARIPKTGDILLLFNYGEAGDIKGAFPRNRMASAISSDEGKTFRSVRIFDGGRDFPGKITMANVVFTGGNAQIFYSKSPSAKNFYSWEQLVVPVRWFYEGPPQPVYGPEFLSAMQKGQK